MPNSRPRYHAGRVNEDIQRELMYILREVKDPRVASAFVSITGAEVSHDLKFAKVYYSILAENVTVESGAVIGEDPQKCEDLSQWGVSVIGAKLTVGENATVKAKAMISENVKAGETV